MKISKPENYGKQPVCTSFLYSSIWLQLRCQQQKEERKKKSNPKFCRKKQLLNLQLSYIQFIFHVHGGIL